MTETVIPDAEVVPDDEPEVVPGTEVIARPGPLAVTPAVEAGELVQRLDVIQEAMEKAMTADVDYGVIPGTGNKPSLLKPGAEKLGVLFQLDVQISNEKIWGPGDHLTVESKATAYFIPTGQRVGFGEGMCSTREKKYGKRFGERTCPSCEGAFIKRSKFPPRNNPNAEPGWYCFARIGGCGANFDADVAAITSQTVGEVENPDIPDTWNTVVKMAEKRARVDVILAVTGASALFTQDVEDGEPSGAAQSAPVAQRPADDPAAAPPAAPASDEADMGAAREAQVLAIGEAITVTATGFNRLGVLFGSIGADRPTINRGDSIAKAVRALTPKQADQLLNLLNSEADRGK